MKNLEKIKESFANFQKPLLRLKEAIEERSDNPLLYDGAIQRFEFTSLKGEFKSNV